MQRPSVKIAFQKLILVSFTTLLLPSCGSPPLATLPADGTILAFGDSLTAGVGATEATSYPTVLAELSDREVINAGISGETTAEGLARLPAVIAQTQPDLMVLLLGGNDILRSQNLDDTQKNLAAMIELAQGQSIEVVLVGVPQRGLSAEAAPLYEELAEDYRLVFEDDLIGTLLRKQAYKSDAVHFNAQGYRVMAEEIHGLLVKNGAL